MKLLRTIALITGVLVALLALSISVPQSHSNNTQESFVTNSKPKKSLKTCTVNTSTKQSTAKNKKAINI